MINRQKTTVYLSGGMGNQLFQIAAGIRFGSSNLVFNISQLKNDFVLREFLFLLEGEKGITVKIQEKSPNFLFRKSHNLSLRSSQISNSNSFRKKTFNTISLLGFFICGINPKEIVTDISKEFFTQQRKKLSKPKYIVGYFQEESNARVIKSVLNEYLDSQLDGKLQDGYIDSDKELIIHVRRGDYEKDFNIGMLSNSYFKFVLEEVFAIYKITQIRLFTNGQVVLDDIIGSIYEGKVFNDLENSPLAILSKMRNGTLFVISNSTLSWWAAYLCKKDKKVVYTPVPWFRRLDEPVNFIPSSWKRFPADWIQREIN